MRPSASAPLRVMPGKDHRCDVCHGIGGAMSDTAAAALFHARCRTGQHRDRVTPKMVCFDTKRVQPFDFFWAEGFMLACAGHRCAAAAPRGGLVPPRFVGGPAGAPLLHVIPRGRPSARAARRSASGALQRCHAAVGHFGAALNGRWVTYGWLGNMCVAALV